MAEDNLINRIMAVIIGTILLVAVAIPVVQTVIDDSNITGITLTIVGFIPLFLAIAGLILATALLTR